MVEFLKNKYSATYERLMEKRRREPLPSGEEHHILPQSCGGSNLPENLIVLTMREHWLAHALLCRMYPRDSKEWRSMQAALCMMSTTRDDVRLKTSRLYQAARALWNQVLSATNSGAGNPFYGKQHDVHPRGMLGKKHTEEKKRQISESSRRASDAQKAATGRHWNTGRVLTQEQRESRGNAFRGKKQSPEHVALRIARATETRRLRALERTASSLRATTSPGSAPGATQAG